ncbi:hypothetical protein AURDEDRAFT_177693 [Auricularia subglabra TFB-10046 SS5]|uniref:Uncharacterized protein n=1 Tax=Auricularia subglabra (strain TFB-10046 / SS5) TaxID=717982 RepID=J0D3G5_AURST|nr:hypothetical protein AURDEDRAFT_177693 [Auricularia subglabra TFB-10046 SS5]
MSAQSGPLRCSLPAEIIRDITSLVEPTHRLNLMLANRLLHALGCAFTRVSFKFDQLDPSGARNRLRLFSQTSLATHQLVSFTIKINGRTMPGPQFFSDLSTFLSELENHGKVTAIHLRYCSGGIVHMVLAAISLACGQSRIRDLTLTSPNLGEEETFSIDMPMVQALRIHLDAGQVLRLTSLLHRLRADCPKATIIVTVGTEHMVVMCPCRLVLRIQAETSTECVALGVPLLLILPPLRYVELLIRDFEDAHHAYTLLEFSAPALLRIARYVDYLADAEYVGLNGSPIHERLPPSSHSSVRAVIPWVPATTRRIISNAPHLGLPLRKMLTLGFCVVHLSLYLCDWPMGGDRVLTDSLLSIRFLVDARQFRPSAPFISLNARNLAHVGFVSDSDTEQYRAFAVADGLAFITEDLRHEAATVQVYALHGIHEGLSNGIQGITVQTREDIRASDWQQWLALCTP